MDKAARNGIRIVDLLDKDVFEEKFRHLAKEKNELIRMYGGEELDIEATLNEYLQYADAIRKYVVDTSVVLNDAIDAGQKCCSKGRKASCSISTKAPIRSLRLRIRRRAASASVRAWDLPRSKRLSAWPRLIRHV